MPRIFAALAMGELILLVATVVLGTSADPRNHGRHVALAVFALLLSCLIQAIAFTYLTVTGKMIGQAVRIGHLGVAPLVEVRRLKRSLTHALGAIVAAIVLAAGTGGAHWRGREIAIVHAGTGYALLVVHLYAYYRQYIQIVRNRRLVERTLSAYAQRKGGSPSGLLKK